ncbi:MAG: AAA family ATPase, partial [bacterium]|nr:AAA family ATPase [bacterium]
MRFEKLRLIAYGPFTGQELVFEQPDADFHLIHGNNEAGKSSTLRALLDLLFGIPERTPDNFLHSNQDLRIGAELAIDGEAVQVIRRKGRVATLRNGESEETVFPDERWASLLPVSSRAQFEQMFGIDYSRLTQGGEELASGEGELGSALF